ncbi:MAG TPA: tryptophan synthase subunit alpha [Candidatus Dormibacteraeota bacterium]|nr:tryptophan synthase subunit alpha [Candidatus Dormibacteraeota bacterium]
MTESLAAFRLNERFQEARVQHRAALIGYLVAGDPDLHTTEMVIAAVAGAGLDVLELGIPFGDPLADGPTVAAAGQRALAAGTTLEAAFSLVERLQHVVPILLFTYFNPVYQYGVERFAKRAAGAGACGVIIPDITLEEIDEVRESLRAQRLPFPLLVSPTTAPGRARQIAAASAGFIYVVSRVGVTGEGTGPDLVWLREQVGRLRQVTDLPLAVGFGISTPEQVGEVATWTDGVIVGSGLVSSYAGRSGLDAARLAGSYVGSLATALTRGE